jgi:hypothetical protein
VVNQQAFRLSATAAGCDTWRVNDLDAPQVGDVITSGPVKNSQNACQVCGWKSARMSSSAGDERCQSPCSFDLVLTDAASDHDRRAGPGGGLLAQVSATC